MELGCSTILYGGYPLDTALDHVKRAGYKAIELCAIPGMAEHLSDAASLDELRQVRRKVHDRGLAIESVGASTNVLDPERRARFERLIQAAGVLGAPAITTGSGGVSDDPASFDETVRVWQELARVATESGVRLSVKPHVRAAVYSTPTALRFVERVSVGLNFDASHLWRADETPEESLRRLAPYLATGRVRDAVSREPGGPGPIEQQIPGGGQMNLPAILAGMAALPYVVLEIVGTRDMPLEQIDEAVQTSLHRLEELMARES
jgi:sugar phosphate isomerase/epimerase